jgi:hypothetical protein
MKEMTMNNGIPRPTVRKVARIEDKATNEFVVTIEFPVNETDVRRLDLSPSIVNDFGRFEDCLVDHGAILPAERESRKALLIEVAESEAPEQLVYEAQGGWLDPGRLFVLPDGAISAENTNILGISRSNAINDPSGKRSKSGSLISWRDSVGQIARLSSLLMFTISVALASLLLAIMRLQSFAFCVYGRTRSGKTIATLVGSSVIGIGRAENLISWNITDARLEQRLAEFNDLLFPIDDLSTMTGGDKEKYLHIREVTYKLSQGWSKGRHSSYEGAQSGWRCILLTSSEKSVRDLAKQANIERQHGEALRLIDIPVAFNGLDHIFDRVIYSNLTSGISDWKRATFANIVADCHANHGAVLDSYLEKIITANFDVEEYVKTTTESFVQHVSEEGDGDVARDVAGKFGLVYAGGMLGIRLGILPWNHAEILDAIAKCFRSARGALPDEGVVLRQGIAVLTARLRTLVRVKKLSPEELASTDWDTTDGYRKRRRGQDHFVIKREVFNALFPTTGQRDLVLQWLIENNRITTAFLKAAPANTLLREPKGQFIWPDGNRRRSYEIVFPRG